MALRDATVADLNKWGSEMPRQRAQALPPCGHRERCVLAAADAFRASNLTHFGEPMRQAHISLRDDFEASCKEIDILVALAGKQPGLLRRAPHRRRLRGCTVNLVAAANVEAFTEAMRAGYREATALPRRSIPAAPPAAPTPSRCRLRAGRLS